MRGLHARRFTQVQAPGPTYENLVPEDVPLVVEPIAGLVDRDCDHEAAVVGRRPGLDGRSYGEGGSGGIELRESSPGLRLIVKTTVIVGRTESGPILMGRCSGMSHSDVDCRLKRLNKFHGGNLHLNLHLNLVDAGSCTDCQSVNWTAYRMHSGHCMVYGAPGLGRCSMRRRPWPARAAAPLPSPSGGSARTHDQSG